MSQYKIVIDSCGELPEDLKADGHFCTVPLLLDVDGYQITDDLLRILDSCHRGGSRLRESVVL